MKVLHVTDTDLPGRHFNGYDLLEDLDSRGIEGAQVVLRKLSDNPKVVGLVSSAEDRELQHRIRKLEWRHSMNNLLFPWGRVVAETAEFNEADVVHYHLIHNGVVSLYDLPWLFGSKPSVWTFHDPWPLTGHCIHPMDSDGWLRGCAPCPYLERLFPIAEDRAGDLWRTKQRMYSKLDIDVVVASEWMLDMVRRSALTAGFANIHLIPFGVGERAFAAEGEKAETRRRLGIPENDFVVMFRAKTSEMKGLGYLVEALAARPPDRPTTLLSVDERGLLGELERDYRVLDLGWVTVDSDNPPPFAACDVFVMPSLAEAFGLMAIEAMAAGKPVVCFEGTALPAVTHAPECGIAVPSRDSKALRDAIDRLAADPDECARRGDLGRQLAREVYSYSRYLDSMAELYRSVLARHGRAAAQAHVV